MSAQIDPVTITPSAMTLHDFDQHVIDAYDVVHTLNPRSTTHALCRRQWKDPWWQDQWVPDNYPRCGTCNDVRAAVGVALTDRWGFGGPKHAARWFVIDDDDPQVVHLLNPVHFDQSLCGMAWTSITTEGQNVPGSQCPMCDLLRDAGVGRSGNGLLTIDETPPGGQATTPPPAPKRAGPSSPNRERKKRQTEASSKMSRAQWTKQHATSAKKARAAARADSESNRSHGYSGRRTPTVSGGLPGLGKRR